MADLTSTQLKLRTTPTAGVSSEQSPYYRRLLSAGYKGFLQGTVGGSTLYGLIGAGIGTLVALPLLPAVGLAGLALIPAMGGLGLYKGAATFGNIGSLAAITAESAEMSEKRRYLLDRYYDLPDTPEFDEEAEQIKNLLAKQHDSKPPEHMFHGRTVLVGAVLGGAIALAALTVPGLSVGLHLAFCELLHVAGFEMASGLAATVATTLAGTALGALSGAVVGLDRFYVRNWLDKSASLMHDNRSIEQQIREREMEIEQLGQKQAAFRTLRDGAPAPLPSQVEHAVDHTTSAITGPVPPTALARTEAAERSAPITPREIAGLDKPGAIHAGSVQHDGLLADRQIQTAL